MLKQHRVVLQNQLEQARRTLVSSYASLPDENALAQLKQDADNAKLRGYYTPNADERLRQHYVEYLGLRAALWQNIQGLLAYIELPRQFKKGDWNNHLRAFGIAFASAALLLRTGFFLTDLADKNEVVRQKLDEAEPRFGIERKQFTAIYDSLVSSRRLARYARAQMFYQHHKQEIFSSLEDGYQDVAEYLQLEDKYIEPKLKTLLGRHIKRKFRFKIFSIRRRRMSAIAKTMFFLFESTGSDIAELKQPLVKPVGAPKRLNINARKKLLKIVKPGDVFITRHDDAMSNLFLPGFWPHAALYIGTDKERAKLGVAKSNPKHQSIEGEIVFLESKKDGVLFRPAEDTLQVDACVILRPKLKQAELVNALERALSHAGKLYDFVFDFSKADRLACTELIYRTYDNFGDIDFELSERAGRFCLSAEDLLNQALGKDWFDVIAVFGVGDNEIYLDQEARTRLLSSYKFNPPDKKDKK